MSRDDGQKSVRKRIFWSDRANRTEATIAASCFQLSRKQTVSLVFQLVPLADSEKTNVAICKLRRVWNAGWWPWPGVVPLTEQVSAKDVSNFEQKHPIFLSSEKHPMFLHRTCNSNILYTCTLCQELTTNYGLCMSACTSADSDERYWQRRQSTIGFRWAAIRFHEQSIKVKSEKW